MTRSAPQDLQKHIHGAYHNLRIGIALIGAALPVLLWLREQIPEGSPLRGSMSVYYYSDVSRDILIGALCAVGVFLYLYKGYGTAENIALNLAGVFAILIALFPTTDPDAAQRPAITVHIVSAALFFICIAYVALFRSADTLALMRDTKQARAMQRSYRLIGIGMLISPIAAMVLSRLLQPESLVFFVEALAVWLFAAYWLLKTWEIRRTNAERLALAGKLVHVPGDNRRPGSVGRVVQVEPTETVDEWDLRLAMAESTLVSRV